MASISCRETNGVWTAYYSDGSRPTGDGGRKQVRASKGFPEAKSHDQAMEMAREWFRRENWPLSRALDDYQEHWTVAEGSEPSYRSVRRRLVDAYMSDVPVSQIGPAEVSDWRDRLRRAGYANNYINKGLSFLSGAFSYFEAVYGLQSNPVKAVKKLDEAEPSATYFDYEQFGLLERLLSDAMDDRSTDPDNVRRRMTAFAAYTALHFGMRCGECCAMKREDVDRVREEIFVRDTVVGNNGPPHLGPPKGRRSRHFSCADEQWLSQYARHLEWREAWSGAPAGRRDPLVTFDGKWTRPGDVTTEFSAMRDEWGLPPETHFHTLRHTHATYSLAVLRQDLSEVSRRLGHADVGTTARIYSHAVPAKDRESSIRFGEMSQRMREGS